MVLTLDSLIVDLGAFSLRGTLDVPRASLVAVVGPSGAGKSTLLSAIAGFVPVTGGRIRWDDQDITALPPGKRPMAILFQDNNLFPHLTAAQNVALALGKGTRPTAAVFDALGQVGLAGFENRKPAELSGGQQSRVALARVLLQDKPLVLLDEPFSALGPAMRQEMLSLVQERLVANGRSVIIVTHDRQDAEQADQIIIVTDGEISPPQSTKAVLSAPPDALTSYWGK